MTGPTSPLSPTFSIVSAVYNVDRYLGDFLSSLERQSYGIENLDIILVDDGSTDDSLATLRAFESKHPHSVRVLTKVNGGQGSARNLGLDHLRGDWVTFTDPDDFLDDNYFDEVSKFLIDAPESMKVVSTSLITYVEATGTSIGNHPLQRKFRHGNRVIDLNIEADCIQMHCSSTLIDTTLVARHALRFDQRIRPTFEDAHFVASSLLASGNTELGAVSTARYNYRKRADSSSTINTSSSNPDKFTTVLRLGLLPLLEAAKASRGVVPVWVQNMVLYDLCWAFKDDSAISSATGGLDPAVMEEFHKLATEVLRYIDSETVERFDLVGLSQDIRFILMHGYASKVHVDSSAQLRDADDEQGVVKIAYRYTGEQPQEIISVDNLLKAPSHAKSRSIEFFGRKIAHERILWIPLGHEIRLIVNNKPIPITDGAIRQGHTLSAQTVQRLLTTRRNSRPEHLRRQKVALGTRLRRQAKAIRTALGRPAIFQMLFARVLRSHWTQSRFGGSWAFMDKDVLAGDNAEHLYRYAREHHPELNAWFVVSRNSPDWQRLRQESFRLVPYGSRRWKLLMMSADVLVSSHIDNYVVRPLAVKRYGVPRWRFVFLQHGVIQSDLSRWLNTKQVDLFVTSSVAEHESIISDSSPYTFTGREVKLLGLPRHDSLRGKRNAVPAAEQKLLLVMPTWRKNLLGESLNLANNRRVMDNFAQSEYAVQYSELLTSERLRILASENGLTLAFMPHPNMAAYLSHLNLPSDVSIFTYEKDDVQQVLARAAMVVTDYSSVAFDAAVVNVPVVYFQFDRESFHAGGHIARSGYFDYERDGFGPVCITLSEVENAIAELIMPTADGIDYRQRMHDTFAHHDQENSRRVFDAILALDTPTMTPSLAVAASVG